MKLALVLLLSLQAQAGVKTWWGSFCERHLVADDPYDPADRIFELFEGERLVQELRRSYVQQASRIMNGTSTNRAGLRWTGIRLKQIAGDRPEIQEFLDNYKGFER